MAKSYNKTQESVSALFHKVLHNFGDWELETAYMSRIERSIYFDMRTLYLKLGQPLTSDLELLARRIRCNDEAELKAFLPLEAPKADDSEIFPELDSKAPAETAEVVEKDNQETIDLSELKN